MLVLSRKVGERILIGDKISVTVVRISGGGVRIGIEAPAELAVVREELQQELLGNDSVDGTEQALPSTDLSGATTQDSPSKQQRDQESADGSSKMSGTRSSAAGNRRDSSRHQSRRKPR